MSTHNPFWVTFEDREPACVGVDWKDGPEQAVLAASEITGCVALSAKGLPYPARPQLNKVGEAWCYSPEKCQGYSSCPNKYACSN